jgi:hypothetical protein
MNMTPQVFSFFPLSTRHCVLKRLLQDMYLPPGQSFVGTIQGHLEAESVTLLQFIIKQPRLRANIQNVGVAL